MRREAIPLTVIGGYLGAGKTTLVNHLLRHPDGRRIGVIVNDFGSLAIDAALLADADTDDLIGLPNGCVCCTVGSGLHEALARLAGRDLDHVVIEVSGVADPVTAAAWGTVPPFEPGGVIVLADATTVVRRSRDRYVGAEVTRQLAGADLVVVTKSDLCDERQLSEVERWVVSASGGAPSVRVVEGQLPAEIVLGVRPEAAPSGQATGVADPGPHDHHYESWSWSSPDPVSRPVLDDFLAGLPAQVLRVKGRVRFDDGSCALVQVVGRRVEVSPSSATEGDRSELVAIALRRDPPTPDPFVSHFG